MSTFRSIVSLLVAFAAVNASAADAFSCSALDAHRDHVVTAETTLGDVPAIVRVPPKISKAPIVLWHGFGPPSSEAALMEALPLDDVPAIKVYLGLPLFGKRAEAGGVEALKRRQESDVALNVFEPIVAGAAKELPHVIAALRTRGCVDSRESQQVGDHFFEGLNVCLHTCGRTDVSPLY